jgi:PIN domain nuclease of toxin-antitoxin system
LRILLDTHLLLWWLANAPSLSKSGLALISEPENTVFVSAVSLWEIWLKKSLGKLRLPDDFEAKMATELFESLPLSAIHARKVASLPWHHRDPFDRMLVAQAQADSLILLTADDRLTRYGGFVRLVR